MRIPNPLAAALLAVGLFSSTSRADVVLPSVASTIPPIEFNFSGECGDCPGDADFLAYAALVQTPGSNVAFDGRAGYSFLGEFTYTSGWFEIGGITGTVTFFSRSGLPGDAGLINFNGYGYVTSYNVPGRTDAFQNSLPSGNYNIFFSAFQRSNWELALSEVILDRGGRNNDFGSGSTITASGGPPPPPAIPEPSTWAMFGTGAVALLFARRRRPN